MKKPEINVQKFSFSKGEIMPSRKLEDLHPLVVEKARQLIELAQVDGIEILVTSTLRSFEEQAELFEKNSA
jgi:LAS superfamily LD-carboxypeptidase LdcB